MLSPTRAGASWSARPWWNWWRCRPWLVSTCSSSGLQAPPRARLSAAPPGPWGGSYFEYLLGRFTEPSEIFGPVDLRKLREGTVETETTGMLPEAEVAFLDEVFLGSTAILNTLLGL